MAFPSPYPVPLTQPQTNGLGELCRDALAGLRGFLRKYFLALFYFFGAGYPFFHRASCARSGRSRWRRHCGAAPRPSPPWPPPWLASGPARRSACVSARTRPQAGAQRSAPASRASGSSPGGHRHRYSALRRATSSSVEVSGYQQTSKAKWPKETLSIYLLSFFTYIFACVRQQ